MTCISRSASTISQRQLTDGRSFPRVLLCGVFNFIVPFSKQGSRRMRWSLALHPRGGKREKVVPRRLGTGLLPLGARYKARRIGPKWASIPRGVVRFALCKYFIGCIIIFFNLGFLDVTHPVSLSLSLSLSLTFILTTVHRASCTHTHQTPQLLLAGSDVVHKYEYFSRYPCTQTRQSKEWKNLRRR